MDRTFIEQKRGAAGTPKTTANTPLQPHRPTPSRTIPLCVMLDQFDNRLDPIFPPTDRAKLISTLTPLLPADGLVTKAEGMRVYETDGLAAYRGMPAVVALPRGAGTGLSGGALPSPGCVLLSLSRMNRILAIDADARTARVQPGVRNLAIS